MKYFFYFFILFPVVLLAKVDSVLDSLQKELAKSEKVSVLLELSKYQKETDKNKALNYALQAKDLAMKVGDSEGENDAMIAIATRYFEMDSLAQSIAFWKKSIAFAQKTGNDKRLIESKKALGDISFRENNYRQALKTYLDILAMKELNDFPEKKSRSKNGVGCLLSTLGKF